MEMPFVIQLLESLAAIATPILVAIGGVFVWYKFIRQGEHDPRLQASVSCEATFENGTAYMVVSVNAKNTGQIDVTIDSEHSALFLLARRTDSGWRDPDLICEIFIGQKTVQPGADLEDKVWIERTLGDDVALCLELAISSEEGRDWRTVEIVPLLEGRQNPGNG